MAPEIMREDYNQIFTLQCVLFVNGDQTMRPKNNPLLEGKG